MISSITVVCWDISHALNNVMQESICSKMYLFTKWKIIWIWWIFVCQFLTFSISIWYIIYIYMYVCTYSLTPRGKMPKFLNHFYLTNWLTCFLFFFYRFLRCILYDFCGGLFVTIISMCGGYRSYWSLIVSSFILQLVFTDWCSIPFGIW